MADTAPRDDAAAESARVKFYGQDGAADDYHEEPAPLPRSPQNLFMECVGRSVGCALARARAERGQGAQGRRGVVGGALSRPESVPRPLRPRVPCARTPP